MKYLQALGVLIRKVAPTTAVTAWVYDPETGCYLKDSVVKSIEEAHEDMKQGRLKSYNSADEMFQELGFNV